MADLSLFFEKKDRNIKMNTRTQSTCLGTNRKIEHVLTQEEIIRHLAG